MHGALCTSIGRRPMKLALHALELQLLNKYRPGPCSHGSYRIGGETNSK